MLKPIYQLTSIFKLGFWLLPRYVNSCKVTWYTLTRNYLYEKEPRCVIPPSQSECRFKYSRNFGLLTRKDLCENGPQVHDASDIRIHPTQLCCIYHSCQCYLHSQEKSLLHTSFSLHVSQPAMRCCPLYTNARDSPGVAGNAGGSPRVYEWKMTSGSVCCTKRSLT